MRTTVTTVLLCLGALLAPASAVPAHAQAAAPAVKKVERRYGGGPVRLAPRQRLALSFTAHRGDRVVLDVRGVEDRFVRCHGRVTLVDSRGARTVKLDTVLRVRTRGAAMIRFRGRCGRSQPVRAQLVKVRMRHVRTDGAAVRVRAPRRGFVDVAWTRVPATGRVKLVARDRHGRTAPPTLLPVPTKQLLIGSRVRQVPRETPSVSVAADERPVLFHPLDDPRLPVLRRGTRVGMVVAGAGTVDARSAVELPVQLDGAAVELPADGGREYVLAVQVPDGTHHYLEQAGRDPRVGSDLTTYEVPGPGDVRRLVVSSDEDTPATEVVSLRVRSILTTTDLVVGGPPVRFEVTDPGRWMTARVPATAYGRFTLTATDVTLPDGWWAEIPGPCWPRDCLAGPRVDSRTLVSTGSLEEGEHTIAFRPAPGTTGGVTLSLTATP